MGLCQRPLPRQRGERDRLAEAAVEVQEAEKWSGCFEKGWGWARWGRTKRVATSPRLFMFCMSARCSRPSSLPSSASGVDVLAAAVAAAAARRWCASSAELRGPGAASSPPRAAATLAERSGGGYGYSGRFVLDHPLARRSRVRRCGRHLGALGEERAGREEAPAPRPSALCSCGSTRAGSRSENSEALGCYERCPRSQSVAVAQLNSGQASFKAGGRVLG